MLLWCLLLTLVLGRCGDLGCVVMFVSVVVNCGR